MSQQALAFSSDAGRSAPAPFGPPSETQARSRHDLEAMPPPAGRRYTIGQLVEIAYDRVDRYGSGEDPEVAAARLLAGWLANATVQVK